MKKYLFPIVLSLVMAFTAGVRAQDAASISTQFAQLLPGLDCTNLADANLVQQQQDAQLALQKLAFEVSLDASKQAEFNTLVTEALAKDQPALTQMWLLRQLRWTGTDKEVPVIAVCLNKNVTFVVDEAAMALASINTPAAKAALEAAVKTATGRHKEIFSGALINANERPQILADRVKVESTMPFAIPYVSKQEVDKWLEGWDSFDQTTKIRTISALNTRGDNSYVAYAVKALNSDSDLLKIAGMCAMQRLATKEEIPAIMNYSGDKHLVARIASYIKADGFDEALKSNMESEKDWNKFLFISKVLSLRNVNISDVLLSMAKKSDCADRLELLRQAKNLSGKAQAGDFVDALVLIPVGGQRDEAEKIIAALCEGDSAPVIEKMKQYPGTALFGCLGRIGGDAAKAVLNEAVTSSDSQTRDAAIKALCNWPNAQGAENLFDLSKNEQLSNGQRIAALRAYIRVVSLPNDQIGIRINDAGKVELLIKAFNSATRLDEKTLVLSRLSGARCVQALDFAIQCAQTPELAEASYRAIADLIHHNDFRRANMDKAVPAMDMIIKNCKSNDIVDRVKGYKNVQN